MGSRRERYLVLIPDYASGGSESSFDEKLLVERDDYLSVTVSAPPSSWLDAAERCRDVVEASLRRLPEYYEADFLATSTTVVSIEGSGPLIPQTVRYKTREEGERLYEALCQRLIGSGNQVILRGEIQSGAAIYGLEQGHGLMTEIRFPFCFRAFEDTDEVQKYLSTLARLTIAEWRLIEPILRSRNYEMMPDLLEFYGNLLLGRVRTEDVLFENFFESFEIELDVGLRLSGHYPGGIYLGALIASGRITEVDGVALADLPVGQLARYNLLAREANGYAATELLKCLQGEGEPFETVYEHGVWERLYIEGGRDQYPLYHFYTAERDNLLKSPEEIWQDANLPVKVRRQLLLQASGMEINPHLHVPRKVFFSEGEKILTALFEEWKMPVGVSSAFYNEPLIGGMPSAQFLLFLPSEEIKERLAGYKKELTQVKGVSLDERDYIICYPLVWQNFNSVVGGAVRFDRLLQLAGERDEESWVVELQRGTMPRKISPNGPGFVRLVYQPIQPVDLERWEPTGDWWVQRTTSPDVTGDDLLLRIAEQEAVCKVRESLLWRKAVNMIRKVTGKESLAIEFVYYQPTGKLVAIDF